MGRAKKYRKARMARRNPVKVRRRGKNVLAVTIRLDFDAAQVRKIIEREAAQNDPRRN